MPTENRSARGKTVTKKPGKRKATESSQGRAQSWWRPSRAWEARVECRWQGKVARKCKNLQWGKTATTTNITRTSWWFFQAKFHRFFKFPKNIKRKVKKWLRHLFKKKKWIQKCYWYYLYIWHCFLIWWRFRHVTKAMANVVNIIKATAVKQWQLFWRYCWYTKGTHWTA